MPERLEVDPEVLRRLAGQHDQVARDTREWAKPPTAWLANFEPTYGKIAFPVKQALDRYYDARQRAGEALASEHEQTANSLRASANSYEQADLDSATGVGRAGQEAGATPTVPTTAGMAPMRPMAPDLGAPAPSGPAGTPAADPGAIAGSRPVGDPGAAGATPGAMPNMGAMPTGASASDGSSTGNGATPGPGAAAPTTGATGPAGATALPGTASGMPLGPIGGLGSGDDRSGDGRPANATAANGMPIPVAPTPFGSAVAAAKDKAAEPDYVVGEEVNEDLVLARTLLSAVLAAAESPVGTAWAVSVMRGPAGAGIFLTSNEGRGWLPAGLYLPREVSTPWLWDELLRTEESPGSPWEGVSDPARILVEFGLAWGAKANAQLAALVSSGPIDPSLRVPLNHVPMEGMVGPAYDVDLRAFTPDTADRLGLTGSVPAIEGVAAVPDAKVRARCLELALDAHAGVGRSVTAPVESAGVRSVRDRILARLETDTEVPQSWWEELREADDLIAAAMISRRVDVGRVGLGELRVDDEVATLRTLTWERRCNELLFVLGAEEPNRQSLRDAVYTHEQVVRHPSFTAAPAPVSTVTDERIDVPADASNSGTAAAAETGVSAPSGAVSPPAVAGPPAGAIVAPPTATSTGRDRD